MKNSAVLLFVVGLLVPATGTAQPQAAFTRKLAQFKWINDLPREAHNRVRHGTFHSKANDARIGFCIYLPEAYETAKNRNQRYPVVYWLHGGFPGSEVKAVRMTAYFDKHIRSGEVPPMIYVFPNGGRLSHYDLDDDKGEQALLELIPHVDASYRTIAERKGRAVEGFSLGGRATARHMFRHAKLFCSAAPLGGGHQHEKRISDNNGTLFREIKIDPPWNNTWDLARRSAESKTPLPRILVAVGDQDMNHRANLQWHKHLESLGIEHDFMIVPGVAHNTGKLYQAVGLEVMRFHAESFRLSGAIK